MSSDGYSQQRNKGIAIASLVVGIVSLFTCSLFFIGGIIGNILGILALNKASKQPEYYAGRGLAIAGIVASAFSLVAGILIPLPDLVKSRHAGYEWAAIGSIRQIATGQAKYAATKGEGKFTDLRTLAAEGLIDFALGSGEKNGYVFTSESVKGDSIPMFDVTAKPISTGMFGTGNRSFYTNESYVVYVARSGSPPTASPQDRVPRNAQILE